MKKDYVEIGKRIKEFREDKGMTQTKLAGILGVSKQAISNIEKGIRCLNDDKIMSISKIFNCSYDYIVGKSDNIVEPYNAEYRADLNNYKVEEIRLLTHKEPELFQLFSDCVYKVNEEDMELLKRVIKAFLKR